MPVGGSRGEDVFLYPLLFSPLPRKSAFPWPHIFIRFFPLISRIRLMESMWD